MFIFLKISIKFKVVTKNVVESKQLEMFLFISVSGPDDTILKYIFKSMMKVNYGAHQITEKFGLIKLINIKHLYPLCHPILH